MANFSLLRCIRSPCWNTGPVGSWLSNISNSLEDLVWSNKAVANFWHWLRSSWNEQIKFYSYISTVYAYSKMCPLLSLQSLVTTHISFSLLAWPSFYIKDHNWPFCLCLVTANGHFLVVVKRNHIHVSDSHSEECIRYMHTFLDSFRQGRILQGIFCCKAKPSFRIIDEDDYFTRNFFTVCAILWPLC